MEKFLQAELLVDGWYQDLPWQVRGPQPPDLCPVLFMHPFSMQ